MIDLKKALDGLTMHLESRCRECPYGDEPVGCVNRMLRDTRNALREGVDENEHLKDTAYNLRLYLAEVEDRYPDLWHFITKRHPGLPGYTTDITTI